MPYALDRPVNHLGRPTALRALAGAVLMLSLGVAASGAVAQPAQAPAGQKPGAATRQAEPAGNPIDTRLAEIKKRLNITAAQQPQFEKFADIVKQNAQAMEALMQKEQQNAKQNALEGLRTAASFAQVEADNLKRLVPALEALYASLSEQQKRTADQLFTTAPPSDPAPQGEPQGRRRG
ncbi:MAG TPA: Spy/CpxP family protein refolding chaperone [Stellaceae bacterium]|nr:Spy/CpxP family protein refolding chaperone [Stellaceae bacterium]